MIKMGTNDGRNDLSPQKLNATTITSAPQQIKQKYILSTTTATSDRSRGCFAPCYSFRNLANNAIITLYYIRETRKEYMEGKTMHDI